MIRGLQLLSFESIEKVVAQIISETKNADVFTIAEKNGVSIEYGDWHPTTIGEFERKTKTIRVNRRALKDNDQKRELEKIIVAHELGHFFAMDFNFDKKDEENFAHKFAETLISAAQNKKIEK